MSDRGWKAYLEAVAATAGSAAIAWFLEPILDTADLGLVFLTGVLIAAVRGGVGPALVAIALSFVTFNFLFTEPVYSFFVQGKRDILTLSLFLLVSLITGQLAARVRRQVDTIKVNSQRIESLEAFSRRLTGIVGRDDFSHVLTSYLQSVLSLDAIVLFNDSSSKLVVAAGDTGGGLTDSEHMAAEWAYSHREPAGWSTHTLQNGAWLFLPLVGRKVLGVLGVRPAHGKRRALSSEQQRLLLAMRDQAGTALDRTQLASAVDHTRLMMETERLRAALLASVSHDLRTPLVSIKGAATALLDLEDTLAASDKRELLENVVEEADRLNRHVQNLLDMTRLGYGAVNPQKDWRDVREIVGAVRRALRYALGERSVEIAIAQGSELIHTDAALLEQILVNLLENAAKYSPPDAPVEIAGRRESLDYELTVCDRGPGIPVAEREHVFELFRRARASDQTSAGAGMGLAICKGFAEALGGSIRVSDRPQSRGACFVIRLPQPQHAPAGRPPE